MNIQPIRKGTLLPQQQRYTETWSPATGYVRSRDFKGIDEKYMRRLMAQYINTGCEARLTVQYGVAELEITDATGQYILDNWQIQQSDLQSSSLQNPNNISADLSDHDLRKLKQAVADNNPDFDDVYDNLEDTANEAAVERLYNRMIQGADHYLSSRFVLRHTTNAPLYYDGVNVADVNVDRIYTLAQLFTECQNTTWWRLPLPPAMIASINEIEFPAEKDFYTIGALKRGPSRCTAANFRQEITTEYWFGQISEDEYQSAV